MIARRLSTSAVLAGIVLIAVAGPAAAHPVTGGTATPLQTGITVIGAIATLAGVGAAIAAGSSTRSSGSRGKLRTGGMILAVAGMLGFIFGPDLAEPAQLPCERPATQAEIQIISPESGAVVDSTDVDLDVRLEGGKVADMASTRNVEGEGHLHISLDGRLASMTGDPQQTIVTEPGEHELEVEYVANDHAPFCTRVADRVRFTVAEPAG